MSTQNKPQRILQILTAMNRGGAESMVMNYYRTLDRSRYQFDFLVNREARGDFDEEIESMGGRIFRSMPIRPWTYPQYFSWLNKFFREHAGEFVAVHGHIQENSGFSLKYAKKYGVRNLVSSSHIANMGIDYKFLFRQFGKLWTNHYAVTKLACGQKAGEFLYGQRPFKILHNAIDTRQYVINEASREAVRTSVGASPDTVVIGNVARLNPQKNHQFILDVFAKVLKRQPNALLLLVGEGELESRLKNQANHLGINDKVRFMGLRSDVNDVLQAFDVFFMPSLFEGLPVSVIEAQAAGLPCVLSDAVDHQTDITGQVQFYPLTMSHEEWANRLCDAAALGKCDNTRLIENAGYDVHKNLAQLLNFYGLK